MTLLQHISKVEINYTVVIINYTVTTNNYTVITFTLQSSYVQQQSINLYTINQGRRAQLIKKNVQKEV